MKIQEQQHHPQHQHHQHPQQPHRQDHHQHQESEPGPSPKPQAHTCGCLPCEIPPLCRNNYFTGKLLTERDFTAEQHYFLDKLRLHHVALHGWGIVCGLKVEPHPYCPERRVIVKAGLAIDGCGREIRVLRDIELELPKPPTEKPEPQEPCPPEPKQEGKAPQAEQAQAAQKEPETEQSPPATPMYVQDEPEPKPGEGEPCPPQPRRYTLYLCLCYAECETEFMPAPFDECVCSDTRQKPNRICEDYRLEIRTERPQSFDFIKNLKDSCKISDCESWYHKTLNGCPQPLNLDCLPLAAIYDYVPGQKVTDHMIDNWTYRMVLPSTSVLDQVIRCILEKLPTHKLTRIEDFNWDHEGDYHCHEFMDEFIGDEKARKNFWIKFEKPLFEAGLSRRTFQVTVVRFPEANGPGRPEIAPVNVWWGEKRDTIHLEINPRYAQTLHNLRFDLYIRLRCNLLVDRRGYPVDGELMAHLDENNYELAPYTGDGIPGGLFESWIRVRP